MPLELTWDKVEYTSQFTNNWSVMLSFVELSLIFSPYFQPKHECRTQHIGIRWNGGVLGVKQLIRSNGCDLFCPF